MYSGDKRLNYTFQKEDSPIIFGRGKSCKVNINSNVLSKKHTTVEYNDLNKNWIIRDGYERNFSLNGTWLCLNARYELRDEDYIKIGNNVVKIEMN